MVRDPKLLLQKIHNTTSVSYTPTGQTDPSHNIPLFIPKQPRVIQIHEIVRGANKFAFVFYKFSYPLFHTHDTDKTSEWDKNVFTNTYSLNVVQCSKPFY